MRWSRSSPGAQGGHAVDEGAHVAEIADGLVVEHVRAVHRQRVEDGGHAVRHQLAVGLVQRRGQVHDHAGARRGHVLHVVRVDVDEAGHHVRTARATTGSTPIVASGCASKSDAPTGSMAAMRPSMTTTSQSGSTRSAHTTVPPRMMQELVSMVQVPFKGSYVGVVSQREAPWCPRSWGGRGRSVLRYASPRPRREIGCRELRSVEQFRRPTNRRNFPRTCTSPSVRRALSAAYRTSMRACSGSRLGAS